MSRLLPPLLLATAVILWPGWPWPARATAPVGWPQSASSAVAGPAAGTGADPGGEGRPETRVGHGAQSGALTGAHSRAQSGTETVGGTGGDTGPETGQEGGARPPAQATALEVAAAVDLLVLALRAGTGVVEALEAVGRLVRGPAGRDLCRVAAAHRWGFEPRQAWGAASAAWRPVSTAMAMAASGGVPPVTLLELTAQELRAAERARVEQATAALGVRLVIPLGVAFLPAFILTSVVPVVLALAGNVLRGP